MIQKKVHRVVSTLVLYKLSTAGKFTPSAHIIKRTGHVQYAIAKAFLVYPIHIQSTPSSLLARHPSSPERLSNTLPEPRELCIFTSPVPVDLNARTSITPSPKRHLTRWRPVTPYASKWKLRTWNESDEWSYVISDRCSIATCRSFSDV